MTKKENLKRYRINKIQLQNHTEFWIEKSIRFFGIHIYWAKVTFTYYRSEEYAIKELESIVGYKVQTIYKFS